MYVDLPVVIVVLAALALAVAVIAGGAAGILYRLDGAPWPQVILASARAGGAVLLVLATVAGVLVAAM